MITLTQAFKAELLRQRSKLLRDVGAGPADQEKGGGQGHRPADEEEHSSDRMVDERNATRAVELHRSLRANPKAQP